MRLSLSGINLSISKLFRVPPFDADTSGGGFSFVLMPKQVFLIKPLCGDSVTALDYGLLNGLPWGAIGVAAFMVSRGGYPSSYEDLEAAAPEFERPLVRGYVRALYDAGLLLSFELHEKEETASE